MNGSDALRNNHAVGGGLKPSETGDVGPMPGGIPIAEGNEVRQYRGGGEWHRMTLPSPEHAKDYARRISPSWAGGMFHNFNKGRGPE